MGFNVNRYIESDTDAVNERLSSYINNVASVTVYDSSGNITWTLKPKEETQKYTVWDEMLANYLVKHGHKPINRFDFHIFYNTEKLHDDIKEYDDIKNLIISIYAEIRALLLEESAYSDNIEDIDDYMCLITSINKLIKLRAILTACIECKDDKLSIAKKEKYYMPVIECYSDTSRDLTNSTIRYEMMYSKCPVKYVDYDEAMFDYRKDRADDNL